MSTERFEYALNAGLALPETGRVLLIAPPADLRIDVFPSGDLELLSRFAPDFEHWRQRGANVVTTIEGTFSAAIVFLPRAKDLARARIWQACQAAQNGLVVVDGQKTDGIAPMSKAIGTFTQITGQISKAHGKLIWFQESAAVPDDWQAQFAQIEGGLQTQPGVFSAGGADPASQALLTHLPEMLGTTIGDFGAGWGFLSAALASKSTRRIHLVEADLDALDCARANVPSGQTQFHWADATSWKSPEPLDTIVMNPPFHTGRKADPSLGQAFIANAAKNLKPAGQLWMVANRHLPYEDTLGRHFGKFDEIGGDGRFKIFQASRPSRNAR